MAESTGLENRRPFTRSVGSNPTPSATPALRAHEPERLDSGLSATDSVRGLENESHPLHHHRAAVWCKPPNQLSDPLIPPYAE